MSKGSLTREHILGEASALASRVGLDGLTIGTLADSLNMSKSGLFAHFRSKEALQIQVLDHAAERFVASVVRPALSERRGAARVRALFERWLAWDAGNQLPGGCIFVAASAELDDQPGPVRDHLIRLQQQWYDALATTYRHGVEAGSFRADFSAEEFAQDLYGIMLAYHHRSRLMRDPAAAERARGAFERLLAQVVVPAREEAHE
ncbi:MAG TPA: TetR/AcrR family transcriptional regulator [Gemmatimonadales bacterium]|nr:TetR/AcrR family transcriptional regulator [Gemmatimonadales bacterium]